MSVIFLIALFLLMAQVLLESAAETNTSKAFNWPIRTLFVVPASAYTFLFLIKESSRQMLSYQILLQSLCNHLAKHGSLWNHLHSLTRCRGNQDYLSQEARHSSIYTSKYPIKWVLQQRSRSHQLFTPEGHKLGWSEGTWEHQGHSEGVSTSLQGDRHATILQEENMYRGSTDKKNFKTENYSIIFTPFSCYSTLNIPQATLLQARMHLT